MKNLFLCITMILTFNLLAGEKIPPIGLQEMINELASVTNPNEAIGRTYILTKPKNFENFKLYLKPSSAFSVSDNQDGTVSVYVSGGAELYNMETYKNTRMIEISPVDFEWSNGGIVIGGTDGKTFQSCSINIKFNIRNADVTKSTLDYLKSKQYSVVLDYDQSTLSFLNNTETEFVFKRNNNRPTTVSLSIFKPDGSLFGKATTSKVAECQTSNSSVEQTPKAKWSSWGDYNECSAICGGGKQARTRTCETEELGIPCVGNSYEERICNTQACKAPEMTKEQKEKLRYHSIGLNIVSATKLTIVNPRGVANYEASITNPFGNKIRCDIVITSSRGINEEAQNLDQKTHFGIEVAPYGQSKVNGQINIMRGRGNTTGLEWTAYTAQYTAENCVFIN